jgi:hypothetical protein
MTWALERPLASGRVRDLVRSVSGVTLTSVISSGDYVGGYRMAGTPDGLGAFDNGDGTFTVLMNHEFGAGVSVPRSHGNTSGAFISRWVIDKNTLKVISGRDQITNLITTGSKNIDRLCSADLPAISAFYNAATGLGYNGRIFTNGEEATPTGRASPRTRASRSSAGRSRRCSRVPPTTAPPRWVPR